MLLVWNEHIEKTIFMRLMISCWHVKYPKQVMAGVEGYSCRRLLWLPPDKREEALSYDEFTIGVYKDEMCSLLVEHWPIEISISSYHFLKKSSENKIIVKIMRKREREIGLVVPANFVYITKDKSCLNILEIELEKRKTLLQDLKLKFYKKGLDWQFPFFYEIVLSKTNLVFMFSLSFILLSDL